MITRHQFSGLMGSAAAGLVAAPYVARGADLQVVRLGNAAGIIDPQLIFLTMGQHPKLNFYKEEGCKMDIVNLHGASQSIQAIAGHSVENSAVSPTVFLNVFAKNPKIDVNLPLLLAASTALVSGGQA